MTGAPQKPKAGPARGDADDRAERLKAALRANLQRRKAQARARDAKGQDAGDQNDED